MPIAQHTRPWTEVVAGWDEDRKARLREHAERIVASGGWSEAAALYLAFVRVEEEDAARSKGVQT